MKKVLALAVLTVLVPSFLSANPFASVNPFENKELGDKVAEKIEAARVSQTSQKEDVEKLKARLIKSLNYFVNVAKTRAYHEYDFMFQSLDSVRIDYMALRKASAKAAVEMAQEVNKPISINNGKGSITIYDYVNMESVVMASRSAREGELWEEWAIALGNDLKNNDKNAKKVSMEEKGVTADTPLAEGLPKDFAYGVKTFRSYICNADKLNVNYALQNMMTAMDAFNSNLKKNPASAKIMAKEFIKPIKTKNGELLYPVSYITNNACYLYGPVQSDLEEFASKLKEYSK